MSLKLNNFIQIQEKENFEGKKEKILILNCRKCSDNLEKFYNSNKCIFCFLNILFNNRNNNFSSILIREYEKSIEFDQYAPFLEYFKKLKKIKNIWHKIETIWKKKCLYEGFACKILSKEARLLTINKIEFQNPIFLYNLIEKNLNSSTFNFRDSTCQNCFKTLKNLLVTLLGILNELKIIKHYKDYQKRMKNNPKLKNFYESYFNEIFLIPEDKSLLKEGISKENEKLLKVYNIGKHDLFEVHIYDILNEYEKLFDVHFSFNSELDDPYFKKVLNNIEENLDIIKIEKILSLENLIKIYKREALNYIESKYRFIDDNKKKLAKLGALQRLNLIKLFPLLIDDKIEEIFLDSPNDKIYLNHQKYGRCRTNIKLNLKEIDRIKTFLRIYSGDRIDYANPSLKLVIKNKYFYCRFAIDVEPVNINNFSLDIRKLNKNIFTIQDLLKNGTLNPFMAAFLYFNILRRTNITVTGETDTGKTTLINALDLLTPKEFRKIYVESVTESLNQFKFEKHQLKFKVDPLESSRKQKFSKQNQIKKLLHRTPDIIYLGEILTREEAEAMFHCLAAGLRGFQTIHSNNLRSLMNRFLHHFKINISCLNDLDLLILMKKQRDERKIISISEIGNNFKQINKHYQHIFKFNSKINDWELRKTLYDSIVIKKLTKNEHINENKFYDVLKIYTDIFKYLSKINKISITDLVEFFDTISYFSFKSINQLEKYWLLWKKSRSLNF